MEKIYLVLTQSGSIPSRLIKFATKAPYNHVSISLYKDLNTMYSFGRVYKYIPIPGAYVKESKSGGAFAHFPDTKAMFLEMEVPSDKNENLKSILEEMYENRKQYSYNYPGLILA